VRKAMEMSNYQKRKEAVREAAIDWQASFQSVLWGLDEVTEWQAKFEKLGRRYGLLTEFRENGIC
jgi:hypothetical protein